jgi:hypothetical protein
VDAFWPDLGVPDRKLPQKRRLVLATLYSSSDDEKSSSGTFARLRSIRSWLDRP